MFNAREVNVICHALGWPKCYRNRFFATNGSQNYDTWTGLVIKGHAEVIDPDLKITGFALNAGGLSAFKKFMLEKVSQ